MAKKGENREVIYLTCEKCKVKNYTTEKNKKNDSQRLELKKYCPKCRVYTVHKEAK